MDGSILAYVQNLQSLIWVTFSISSMHDITVWKSFQAYIHTREHTLAANEYNELDFFKFSVMWHSKLW